MAEALCACVPPRLNVGFVLQVTERDIISHRGLRGWPLEVGELWLLAKYDEKSTEQEDSVYNSSAFMKHDTRLVLPKLQPDRTALPPALELPFLASAMSANRSHCSAMKLALLDVEDARLTGLGF